MIYKLLTTELFISCVFLGLAIITLIVAIAKPSYVAARKAFLVYTAFYTGTATVLIITTVVASFAHWVV